MCQAAVGVVGDLGRNLGVQLLPHCDDLMTILLEGLIVSYFFLTKIKSFLDRIVFELTSINSNLLVFGSWRPSLGFLDHGS